jgi:hypothetical protein
MNWPSMGNFRRLAGERADGGGDRPGVLSRHTIFDPSAIGSRPIVYRLALELFQPRRGAVLRSAPDRALVTACTSSLGDDQRVSQLKDVLTDQSRQPALDVVIAGDLTTPPRSSLPVRGI